MLLIRGLFIILGSFLLTDLIEVERELSWNGTVEPGFEVRCPVLIKNVLATGILLADSCYSRIHRFAAVDEFHGCLAEEEENVWADIEGTDKVRFWKKNKDILFTSSGIIMMF